MDKDKIELMKRFLEEKDYSNEFNYQIGDWTDKYQPSKKWKNQNGWETNYLDPYDLDFIEEIAKHAKKIKPAVQKIKKPMPPRRQRVSKSNKIGGVLAGRLNDID